MSRSAGKNFSVFKEWIVARGAELLTPTNEYEVVRFLAFGETSIIYQRKSGQVSFVGQARAGWDAFHAHRESFRFADRGRRTGFSSGVIVRTLLDRDGEFCFYCGGPFTESLPPTKEHLVARTHGGPDHIANLFLACEPCNREAGHMSAVEKIHLRDRKRGFFSTGEKTNELHR